MKTIGIRLAALMLYTALTAACVVVPHRSSMSDAQQPPPAELTESEAGATFTVVPEPLPESVYYSEEPEVLVPVVIGQPVYYPPPVAVTYAYDYFTYEQVGVFVDIVFWKDGRRHRSEVWYDSGRRMTVKRMRAHRVRHSEARRHHELLERNHHIHHPAKPHGRRDDGRRRDDRGRNHKNEEMRQVPPLRQPKTPQPSRNGMLRATLPHERPASPPQQQAPTHREKRRADPTPEPPKQAPAQQPAQQGEQPPKNIFGVRK